MVKQAQSEWQAQRQEFENLLNQALDCARRGVALPYQVYDVRNRGRIDWSRFPEWARPLDPVEFTGTAHEG